MRFVLLHYHILKNAGTTIEEILERNFAENFARYDTDDREGQVDDEHLLAFLEAHPNVRAFSSHHIFYPVPRAPGFLFFDLCFLRDPLDRIRSTYDYFRKRPASGHSVSDLANQVTLGAFTAHLIEHEPWLVNDVQVNLLANGVVHDRPRGIEDLEKATTTMHRISFLGVVDRFDQSIAAGKHALRMPFPNLDCEQPPVNVSGGMEGTIAERTEKFRAACGPAVFEELLRMNAMDYELLERARAEVERRYRLISPPVYERPGAWKQLFKTDYARASQLFDPEFYLERNPDVRNARIDPLQHYLRNGANEGRKPHPFFQPDYYISQCPELRHTGENPLLHFLRNRRHNPHPLFNCTANPLPPSRGARTRACSVETHLDAFPSAELNIQDVKLLIYFAHPAPELYEQLQASHPDAIVAAVWKDPSGRTNFLAPSPQRAFFEAIDYDQLFAQLVRDS